MLILIPLTLSDARIGAVGEFPLGQQQQILYGIPLVLFQGSGSFYANSIVQNFSYVTLAGSGQICAEAYVRIGRKGAVSNVAVAGPGISSNIVVAGSLRPVPPPPPCPPFPPPLPPAPPPPQVLLATAKFAGNGSVNPSEFIPTVFDYFGMHVVGPIETNLGPHGGISTLWPPWDPVSYRVWNVFGGVPPTYTYTQSVSGWESVETSSGVFDWSLFDLVWPKCLFLRGDGYIIWFWFYSGVGMSRWGI